jgi:hypothetical protein
VRCETAAAETVETQHYYCALSRLFLQKEKIICCTKEQLTFGDRKESDERDTTTMRPANVVMNIPDR